MFKRANLTPVEAAVSAAKFSAAQATRLPLQRRPGGFTLPKQRERFSAFTLVKQRGRSCGFTLTELLVTMGVLVVLVLLFTQLLNSAATTMTLGNKRMDADSQARQLLDRMAIDFNQMVKRRDVSYFVKTLGNPQTAATQGGNPNDQIAFFSAVPGYYSQGYNSNASLVAYRVNAALSSPSYTKLERMGKGLSFNGAYAGTPIPLLFLDNPANPTPTPTPTTTIDHIWPAATSSTTADPDFEAAGPQVFRFEYYYLLSSSPSVGTANQLSAGPWSNVNSFVIKDVAAIVVAIAVIEPKSKVLLDNDQMATLAGTLQDFPTGGGSTPGQLLTLWQAALDANTLGLPRPAISGIRLYERYFYLNQ
jgi:prepilin-type N-terminal cleavage/methylation domain-containing protein